MKKNSRRRRSSSNNKPLTRADTVHSRMEFKNEPDTENNDFERKMLTTLASQPRTILTRERYFSVWKTCGINELNESDDKTSTALRNMSSIASVAPESKNLSSHNSSLYEMSSLTDISTQGRESENVIKISNGSVNCLSSLSNNSNQAQASNSTLNVNSSSLCGLDNIIYKPDAHVQKEQNHFEPPKEQVHCDPPMEQVHFEPPKEQVHFDPPMEVHYEPPKDQDNFDTPEKHVDLEPSKENVNMHSKSPMLNRWIEHALDIILPYVP